MTCAAKRERERNCRSTFVDYEDQPREYFLNAVSTVLDVHTRVSDLYSSPHDQIKEQLRLTIETIKEKQENELINNAEYGLLAQRGGVPIRSSIRLTGAPTPDDLDELLTKVWKEPAFFLTHPLAIAAFGRECHPPWRAAADGQPVRLAVPDLAWDSADPVGQGAGGRWQDQDHPAARRRKAPGRGWVVPARACPASRARGCRCASWASINNAISSYLISLYCSLAVQTDRRAGRARRR